MVARVATVTVKGLILRCMIPGQLAVNVQHKAAFGQIINTGMQLRQVLLGIVELLSSVDIQVMPKV